MIYHVELSGSLSISRRYLRKGWIKYNRGQIFDLSESSSPQKRWITKCWCKNPTGNCKTKYILNKMLIDLLETVGGKTDNIALTVVGCIALKKQCHCWICCHHNGYSPSKIIYTIIIMYKHISLLPQCIRGETKYWTKKVKNNTKRDEDCCLCNLFWCWTRWSRVVGACCLQLGIEHSFVWMKDNVAINANRRYYDEEFQTEE